MDSSAYEIRPWVDQDFEGMARLSREIDPEHAATAAELRHWDDLLNVEPGHLNLKLAVKTRATQEMVCWGSLAQPSFNFDPRRFWIWVAVVPAHRRKGIGTALFDRLEQEARSRHGVGVWGNTKESDPEGVRFFEARGFKILRRVWQSRLDLAELDLSRIPDRAAALERAGIRFSTLAEEGATSPSVRRSLHHLSELASADTPTLGRIQPTTFEEFVAMDLDTPGSMPEAFFLAWRGVDAVGMTYLSKDLARPDTLRVGFTGIHASFRGRGIGTELKRRAVVFAQQRAVRFLVTGNDSLNRPILAINERLGFRRETVWIQGERPVRDAPE
jgi:mycothiol synthase